MFIWLLPMSKVISDRTGELHLPFSLLKVHHGMGNKAPVSSARACTNTGHCKPVTFGVSKVHGLVCITGGPN